MALRSFPTARAALGPTFSIVCAETPRGERVEIIDSGETRNRITLHYYRRGWRVRAESPTLSGAYAIARRQMARVLRAGRASEAREW